MHIWSFYRLSPNNRSSLKHMKSKKTEEGVCHISVECDRRRLRGLPSLHEFDRKAPICDFLQISHGNY